MLNIILLVLVKVVYQGFVEGDMQFLFFILVKDVIWNNYLLKSYLFFVGLYYGIEGVKVYFSRMLVIQQDCFDIIVIVENNGYVMVIIDWKVIYFFVDKIYEGQIVYVFRFEVGKLK